jgi:hypothetical protein
MPQTEIEPVQGGCQHMRARFKLQTSHRSPFPEKRFMRYECDRGHRIYDSNEEDLQKCLDQKIGCWKEA